MTLTERRREGRYCNYTGNNTLTEQDGTEQHKGRRAEREGRVSEVESESRAEGNINLG